MNLGKGSQPGKADLLMEPTPAKAATSPSRTSPSRRRLWYGSAIALALITAAVIYWTVTRGSGSNGDPDPPIAKEPPVPDGPAWFQDMTADSGLDDFTYKNGEEADLYTILESVGGGVAMIDYDNDGL